MSLRKLFSRPKWKSKDPVVRAHAVAGESNPEFHTKLVNFAQHDNDARVRAAATHRLIDINVLVDIVKSENDDHVKSVALTKITTLLDKNADIGELSLSSLLPLLPISNIVKLCSHDLLSIRKEAVKYIPSQGKLGDLLIVELDEGLRSDILQRISQQSTLQRVAEKTRKTNKSLYHDVLNRLQDIQLKAGDTEAIEKLGKSIFERLIGLQAQATSSESNLKTVEEDWLKLPRQYQQKHQERYQRARTLVLEIMSASDPQYLEELEGKRVELLEQHLQHIKKSQKDIVDAGLAGVNDIIGALRDETSQLKVPQTEAAQSLVQKIEDELSKCDEILSTRLREMPGHESLIRLHTQVSEQAKQPPFRQSIKQNSYLESRLLKVISGITLNVKDLQLKDSIKDILSKLAITVTDHSEKVEQAAEKYPDLVAHMKNAMDENLLHKAAEYRQKINSLRKLLSHHILLKNNDLNADYRNAEARYNELSEWLLWSNNEKRESLIKDLSALPVSEMHPDAVAEIVKKSQIEWKKLDQSEALSGDSSKHKTNNDLWKQFHTITNQLYKPAKMFFKKRNEVQKVHLGKIHDHINDLKELTSCAEKNWKNIFSAMGYLRIDLRDIDNLPPASRGKTAAKIREVLHAADKLIEEKDDVVARVKNKIIDKAKEVSAYEDTSSAADEIKQLQKQWQDAGSMQRRREQALWKEFRIHCDKVFNKLKEQKNEDNKARNLNNVKIEEYLSQYKAVITADDVGGDPVALRRKMNVFVNGWEEISSENNSFENSYQQLVSDTEQLITDSKVRQGKQQHKNFFSKLNDCMDKESGVDVVIDDSWHEVQTNTSVDKAFSQRIDMKSAKPSLQDSQWNDTLLLLEYSLGLDSPQEYSEQRMKLQVDLLSRKLDGELSDPSGSDLWQQFNRLVASYPLSKALLTTRKRLKAIEKQLI